MNVQMYGKYCGKLHRKILQVDRIISGVGLWVIYNLFFILFVGSHFLRGHVQFLFHFSFFFFLKVRVQQIF